MQVTHKGIEAMRYPLPSCHSYFYSMSVVMVIHGVLRRAAMCQGRGERDGVSPLPHTKHKYSIFVWLWSLSKMALKHRRVIKTPKTRMSMRYCEKCGN